MDKTHSSPLTHVQELLKRANIDSLLLRSTDRFFNEYVPEYDSARAYLTGFNGSVGDAVIGQKSAQLFVDGRYSLQAKKQAPNFSIDVCGSHGSIEQRWLSFLSEQLTPGQTLAFDPATLSLSLYERLAKNLSSKGIKLDAKGHAIIKEALSCRSAHQRPPAKAFIVPPDLCGASVLLKREHIKKALIAAEVAGFLAVKLDDIAWTFNMRGNYFPFQSTVPALACVLKDSALICPLADLKLPDLVPGVRVVQEGEFFQTLKELVQNQALGIDELETSKAHEMALRSYEIGIKKMANPLASLKAIKNGQELHNLRHSFRKADQVVYQTQNFVTQSYEKGEWLSEGEIDDRIKEQFFSSGATELSFRPICAGGQNGAVIHYGTPNREEKVSSGSLFLLDTGAYYQGGYATDLTRTFFLGDANTHPKPWQKEMFTLVLKASIRGLSARLRRGTLGMQLDAMVRAPLWQAGVDYAHGTGHGIGINVHEFPPRIGPTSPSELKEGQVFSIEPGIYVEGLGGVRIENLATIVVDPDNANFLRVLPLTFCPLDQRLIENSMLDADEQAFLQYFAAEWQNEAPMPKLPPTKRASFIGT